MIYKIINKYLFLYKTKPAVIKQAFEKADLDAISDWVQITVGPYVNILDQSSYEAITKTTFFQMLIGKFNSEKFQDNIKKKCRGKNVKFYETQQKCWTKISPKLREHAQRMRDNNFKF